MDTPLKESIENIKKYDRSFNTKQMKKDKKQSQEIAYYLDKYHLKGANRMKHCNDRITLAITNKGNLKVANSNRCGLKMCPHCNRIDYIDKAKKSDKIVNKANQIASKRYKGYQGVFLTFTMKNVNNSMEAKQGLNAMQKSVNSMFNNRKCINDYCLGKITSKECPVSPYNLTLHPHIHVLAWFKSQFFNGKGYFKMSKWSKLYNHYMNKNYDPFIYVEKIQNSYTTKNNIINPTMVSNTKYVARYQVKPYNVLDNKQLYSSKRKAKVIYELSNFTSSIRQVSYSGVFGEASKVVNQDIREKKRNPIEYVTDDSPKFYVSYDYKQKDYLITGKEIPNRRLMLNIKFRIMYKRLKLKKQSISI